MFHTDSEEISIDIKEILQVLYRRFFLICIIGILCAAASGLISKYLIKPSYTSAAKVYVINRQDENKITYSDIQTGTQLTKDYMILVKSRPVMEKVISSLNLNISSEKLADMIYVDTPADTRILEINVTYDDAVMAKQIVDSIAEVSADQMANVMEIEKVNLVEQGNLPTKPSSPNIKINTLYGLIIGIIIPSMVVIIKYLLNDAIKNQEDIERYLGITLLGIIPMEDKDNRKKKKGIRRLITKKAA